MRTDQFKLITYQNIDLDERNVITLLYQPIIGCKAYSLYFTLWSLIDRSRLKSPEYTHRKLFDLLCLAPEEFIEARKILEAIGLLVVYQNEELFLYELKAPVTAEEFIKHGSLGSYLYNKIGKTEFEEISNLFRISGVEKNGFKNITTHFDEVFTAIPVEHVETSDDYINRAKPKINMKHQFDFDLFVEGLSKNYVDRRRLTKKVREQIIQLSFIYNLDELGMQKAFMDSVDNDRNIHFDKLVKRCKYWSSMMKQTKDVLEEVEENIDVTFENIKELCVTSDPIDLLGKLTGHGVSSKEKETLINAMSEFDLSEDVFNYLIMYAYHTVNSKHEGSSRALLPNFTYLDSIYTSWKRQNVQTIEDAHNVTMKYKDDLLVKQSKPNTKSYKQNRKTKEEPEWLDKVRERF